MDSLKGRQPVELQAELDGKLAALRQRAGALAAEDGPTRQVGQAAALSPEVCGGVSPSSQYGATSLIAADSAALRTVLR